MSLLYGVCAAKAILELYSVIDVVNHRERLCIITTLVNQTVILEVPTYMHDGV